MPVAFSAPNLFAKRWSRTTPRTRLRTEEMARMRVAEMIVFLLMSRLALMQLYVHFLLLIAYLALSWYNEKMEKTQTQTVSAQRSLWYRLIRLYPHEVSRTAIVWTIRLLYRFVFVVSWTLIVAHIAGA